MLSLRPLVLVVCTTVVLTGTVSTHARGSTPAVAITGVSDGALTDAIVMAAAGAARRLATPACADVLDRFSTANGDTLRSVVEASAWSADAVVGRVIFRDGRDAAACRQQNIAAFTGPGSRVVFVCGQRFASLDRTRAELTVVHEVLHTLGLQERPPLPGDIDREIARGCRG